MTVDPSTTEMPGNDRQAVQSNWRAFYRRSVAFYRRWRNVIRVVACAAVILTAIQLLEDRARHVALYDIQAMGFQSTIKGYPGPRIAADFVATKPELTDAEIEKFGTHLSTLARRHDFWLSDGLAIQFVDLTQSHTSPDAVAKLQGMLPSTEMRR